MHSGKKDSRNKVYSLKISPSGSFDKELKFLTVNKEKDAFKAIFQRNKYIPRKQTHKSVNKTPALLTHYAGVIKLYGYLTTCKGFTYHLDKLTHTPPKKEETDSNTETDTDNLKNCSDT